MKLLIADLRLLIVRRAMASDFNQQSAISNQQFA
jgi:hypothetical protein